MKSAISGAWIYAIVLVFMMILIAYVTVTINYAHTFELSEHMLKIIEQSEGFNGNSRKKINQYLESQHHTIQNYCNVNTFEDKVYGIVGESDITEIKGNKDKKYDYCISRTKITSQGTTRCYYRISIFFAFSVPILGDLYAFNVPGETLGLTQVNDDTFGAC